MNKIYEIAGETINTFLEDGFENSTKPVLLFIHGFGDSLNTIRPILHKKNRPFVIAAFDMPGCGKSSWNIKPITLEHYFNVASSFVDNILKNKEVYVIGHSLGSLSALYLLKNNKAKFATLVGPAHYIITRTKVNFGKKYLIPQTREDAVQSYLKLTANPELFKNEAELYANMVVNANNLRFQKFDYLVNSQMLNYEYVYQNYFNLYNNVQNYQICVGDKDQFTLVEEIKLVGKQMNKEVKIITNAGHSTFYDNPDEIYEFCLKMFN